MKKLLANYFNQVKCNQCKTILTLDKDCVDVDIIIDEKELFQNNTLEIKVLFQCPYCFNNGIGSYKTIKITDMEILKEIDIDYYDNKVLDK